MKPKDYGGYSKGEKSIKKSAIATGERQSKHSCRAGACDRHKQHKKGDFWRWNANPAGMVHTNKRKATENIDELAEVFNKYTDVFGNGSEFFVKEI